MNATNTALKAPRIDITILISNVQRLQYIFKPILRIIHFLDKVQRWDSKFVSGSVLICWNCVLIYLPPGLSLFLSLLLLSTLAAFGYLYTRSGIPANWSWKEILSKPGEKIDHVVIRRHYYALLVQMNELLEDILSVMFKIHQALSWGDTFLAAQYYSVLSLMVISFHMLPLRWFTLLLGNSFLAQQLITKGIQRVYFQLTLARRKVVIKSASLHDLNDPKENSNLQLPTSKKDVIISRSLQDLRTIDNENTSNNYGIENKFSVKQESASVRSSPIKQLSIHKNFQSYSHDSLLIDSEPLTVAALKDISIPDVQESTNVDSWSSDNLVIPNTNTEELKYDENVGVATGNVFGRIKEFRRRVLNNKELAVKDKCFICDEKFTTLLKRRRVCANCGNQYCTNCCNKRIPKSFLGATSPTAQTESVLVCNYCHLYLTKDKKIS